MWWPWCWRLIGLQCIIPDERLWMLMNSEQTLCSQMKIRTHERSRRIFLKDLKIFLKTVHQAWKERGTSVHKEPWRRRVAQIVEKMHIVSGILSDKELWWWCWGVMRSIGFGRETLSPRVWHFCLKLKPLTCSKKLIKVIWTPAFLPLWSRSRSDQFWVRDCSENFEFRKNS